MAYRKLAHSLDEKSKTEQPYRNNLNIQFMQNLTEPTFSKKLMIHSRKSLFVKTNIPSKYSSNKCTYH